MQEEFSIYYRTRPTFFSMKRPIEHNFFVCKVLPVLAGKVYMKLRLQQLSLLILVKAIKLMRLGRTGDAVEVGLAYSKHLKLIAQAF